MARRGRRTNNTGRSEPNERHVRIHQWLMNSAAFRDLDPFEVRVLLELYSLYHGTNNGYLFLSVREAARRCNMGKNKAGQCLKKLQRLGFIRRRADEPENYKLREANYWILTEFDCFGRPSTRDFMCWSPNEKSVARPASNTPRPGSGAKSVQKTSKNAEMSSIRDNLRADGPHAVSERGHRYNHAEASDAHRTSTVST